MCAQGAVIAPPAKNEYDKDAFDRVAAHDRAIAEGSEEGREAMDPFRPDAYAAQRAAFERFPHTARMVQGRWEGRGRWAAWGAASRAMVLMIRTAPRPLAARA